MLLNDSYRHEGERIELGELRRICGCTPQTEKASADSLVTLEAQELPKKVDERSFDIGQPVLAGHGEPFDRVFRRREQVRERRLDVVHEHAPDLWCPGARSEIRQ